MKNHSDAYIDFIKQIDATGYQKAQGYDPDLFNKISDSERNEVEQTDIRDNSYYYLNNAHGDVVGLVDAKGTVVNSYKYECAKQSLAVSVGENLTQEKASHHPVTVDLRPYW